MYEYELKIPIERVAVLVGVKGSIKRKIQSNLKVKIQINSKEGDVFISGEDNLNLMIAESIIKAIGRGFNPLIAMQLLNDNIIFELIDISDYAKTQKDIIRLRGRAIGENGKCRTLISKLLKVDISVYGKTVGIIGGYEDVDIAKRAMDKLLKGSTHGKVFSFVQEQKKNLRINL